MFRAIDRDFCSVCRTKNVSLEMDVLDTSQQPKVGSRLHFAQLTETLLSLVRYKSISFVFFFLCVCGQMAAPFHLLHLLAPEEHGGRGKRRRGGGKTDDEAGEEPEGGGGKRQKKHSFFEPLSDFERADTDDDAKQKRQQQLLQEAKEEKDVMARASKNFYKNTGLIRGTTSFQSLVELVTSARSGATISEQDRDRLLQACREFLQNDHGASLLANAFPRTRVGEWISEEVFGREALANFPLFKLLNDKLNNRVADLVRVATQRSWSAMTEEQKFRVAIKLLPAAQSDPRDAKFLTEQDYGLKKQRRSIVDAVKFLRLMCYLGMGFGVCVTPSPFLLAKRILPCHAMPEVSEKGTTVTVTTKETGTVPLIFNDRCYNHTADLPDGAIVSLPPRSNVWKRVEMAARVLLGYNSETTEDPPVSSLRRPLLPKLIFAHIASFLIPVWETGADPRSPTR